METVEKNDNEMIFTSGMTESLANAIRRYVNEIPVLAVDELEISKNDSALYDETIAHRIGLIPLKMEKGTNEDAKLKLSAKEGWVYSGEIKGNVKPVYDKIPITLLEKGQELELTATLKAGKGSEHAKFSPGLMFYRNVLEITMDSDCKDDLKKMAPNADVKEKGKSLVVVDDRKQNVADICEEICMSKGKKPEIETKDELVVTLESFGQLDVKDIFTKSIDALKKDLTEVDKKVK